MKKKCLSILLSCVCAMTLLAGCGDKPVTVRPEDVELLEPAGVAVSFELAAYRNLYDAKVYNALVCPDVTEYSLENTMEFDRYGALPGDEVQKDQVLIQTNTEGLDEQIKDKEKYIAGLEEDYQDYLKDVNKALSKSREDEALWGQAVENWAREKPAEDSKAYAGWKAENDKYERNYRNALISVQSQEEAIRQRKGLYELDMAHEKLLLKRLREDKNSNTIISKKDGVVTSARLYVKGNWMEKDVPVLAVADVEKKLLKSEYVNKSTINRAEEVYAIIGGKRYEVEYEPMETDEYNRLYKLNEKVFSTFYPQGDISGIEMGAYGVIVVIGKSKKSVLTIPKDAITREEGSAYVYVLDETGSVYTPVQTGMDDGAYVEVLSGIREGDKILTSKASVAPKKTVKLERGEISNKYETVGNLAYPTRRWIDNPIEYGTAYFVEGCVSLNQPVNKGDVIARIRVKADDVALARNERKLQRERERMAELKKDESANEKAIIAKQKVIAELEELIAKMKADFATTEVTAPYDGIVVLPSTNWWEMQMPFNGMKEGTLLSKGQHFLMLAELGSNYIVVNDENGLLTYGNQAEVRLHGLNKGTSGMVVSLNEYSIGKLLFNNSQTLIRVPAEDVGNLAGSSLNVYDYWSQSSFDITVTTRKMENVLLVPKSAVVLQGGATYVKLVQENGEVLLQSFVAGGSDSKNYWVAEGLTEGMEVCIE